MWLPHAVQLPIFLSTPSARRATAPSVVRQCPLLHFYPRPPRGGRLVQKLHEFFTAHISIHALREEGDVLMGRRGLGIELFLSTPSARRATANLRMRSWWPRYFYPRPPRGGRQVDFSPLQPSKGISIHALREEGDRFVAEAQSISGLFLSTPSARRATAGAEIPATRSKHFYPRPPRGGRRYAPFRQHSPFHISIHALREEGDARQRRADRCAYISIHALREEGDKVTVVDDDTIELISIHALREEGDTTSSNE